MKGWSLVKLGESSITRTIAIIHYYTTAYTTRVKGETIFAKRIKLRIAINTPICICELSYVYSRIVLGVWTYTPTCPVVYDHTSGHVNQSYFILHSQINDDSFGGKEKLYYFCTDLIAWWGLEGQNLIGKKDVYERYLRHQNLANSSPEENATEASMLGVLYPVHIVFQCVRLYNTSRRGLSSCLSWTRQCESPDVG